MNACGREVMIVQQPPKSPDLNVLDLGVFNMLAKMTEVVDMRTIEDLIKVVTAAYKGYEWWKMEKVWITLQTRMLQIMENEGLNNFKPMHYGKNKRLRRGETMISLSVPEDYMLTAWDAMHRLEPNLPANMQQCIAPPSVRAATIFCPEYNGHMAIPGDITLGEDDDQEWCTLEEVEEHWGLPHEEIPDLSYVVPVEESAD